MKGFWAWAKESVSWIGSGISQTYQALSGLVSSFVSSPTVRNYANSASLKAWEGGTVVMEPSNVTRIANSPKTRSGLKESFKANVVYYLSLAMLLEAGRQAIMYRFSDEDDSYLESSAYLAMNTFIMIGLGGIMLHRVYDNIMINLAISKQVVDENPTSQHFRPCGCDDGALISAGLFSSINLSGKLFSIWAASFLPVVKYVTPLAYMYAYGESLAEYTYSAAGQCTDHRAKELSKHKAYSFGIGAMLYASGELISCLISSQTGVNSFFISNAVYAAIYPYFVTAVLLRNRPVPGDDSPGVEIFYYHRYVLQHMMDNIGKQILPMLKSNAKAIDWKKKLQEVSEMAPVRWSRKLVSYDLYGDWKSLEGLETSPSTMLFFDEYYAMIMKQLGMVIDLRDKPLHQRRLTELPLAIVAPMVPVIPKRITNFFMTDSYRNLIKIIFDQWLEDPLKSTQQILEDVRHRQISKKENAKIKVICHDRLALRKALEVASQSGTRDSSLEAKPVPLSLRSPEPGLREGSVESAKTIADDFVMIHPGEGPCVGEEVNPEHRRHSVLSEKTDASRHAATEILSRSSPLASHSASQPMGAVSSSLSLFTTKAHSSSAATVLSGQQPARKEKKEMRDFIIEDYMDSGSVPSRLRVAMPVSGQERPAARVRNGNGNGSQGSHPLDSLQTRVSASDSNESTGLRQSQ
ncbi:hypothetical protein AQUSIP_19540 [Aquicella siphonis]|uniref:Uncharacterized protein n=1 Tax=Aquicella siphonis TaxID=254247 RepID=A0A5E4PJU5_9COXI|nr:hypothetical protein [Aquicella siphonis]VVC76631.1 hypothetical protein AQUSIP_19540 [Aquicella siphonis]